MTKKLRSMALLAVVSMLVLAQAAFSAELKSDARPQPKNAPRFLTPYEMHMMEVYRVAPASGADWSKLDYLEFPGSAGSGDAGDSGGASSSGGATSSGNGGCR